MEYKCSFCGYEFAKKDAGKVCTGCVMATGCKLVKCPNCGYEWPKLPNWITKIGEAKEKRR